MILILRRVALMGTYTQGYLFVDNNFVCDTLENRVREKYTRRCKTKPMALAPGNYDIRLVRRHRGKPMPMIRVVGQPRYEQFTTGTNLDRLGSSILVGHNTCSGLMSHDPQLLKTLHTRIKQALLCRKSVQLIIE